MHFDLDEIQNENVTSPFESLVDTLDKPEFKQFNYKYQSQAGTSNTFNYFFFALACRLENNNEYIQSKSRLIKY